MAEALKIRVEPRDPAKNKGTGTRVARRIRQAGRVPAVIYGHKQEVVPITLSRDDVWHMIKAASHLAELDLGTKTETVLIRDVQWDNLGKEILHLDFARVSAEELIETDVNTRASRPCRRRCGGGHPRAARPLASGQVPRRSDSRLDQGGCQQSSGRSGYLCARPEPAAGSHGRRRA